MRAKQRLSYIVCAVALAGFSCACAPKIYVIDRQTVLEDEAAGEWPQFDKELVTKSASRGPTPFPSRVETESEKKLYNVLNAELVSAADKEGTVSSAPGEVVRGAPTSAAPVGGTAVKKHRGTDDHVESSR